MILIAEFTVNVAAEPWNFTAVVAEKSVPLIVTDVPTGPLDGEKPLMCGAPPDVTRKLLELVAVPDGAATLILPVVAPTGTVAVILAPRRMVNVADTPPNVTAVTSVKPLPKISTDVPTGPLAGLKLEMVGGVPTPVTLKFVLL